MSRQFFVRSFVGTAFLLAATSLVFAQHGGGHGGGHSGRHGGGHGGHGGSHFGGHGGRHSGGHGGRHVRGHGGGHGGRHIGGHSLGGHGVGHSLGGHGVGHGLGGHGVGHSLGGHGVGHGLGGHGVGHGFGGHGGHFDYGHVYPYFGFSISPWYGGYGYGSSCYLPAYYAGSYTTGYRAAVETVEITDVTPIAVGQVQPSVNRQVTNRPITTVEGEAFRRKAEAAFRAGDFQRAARMANHALVEMPRNGKFLLFAAQTLFAVGDYRNSALLTHQATDFLDPQQWGYVVENYKQFYRGRAYVDQMALLSKHLEKNPGAAYAYFLRGYQRGFLGHLQSARTDLNKTVEIESRDQLAKQLILRFGGTPPANLDQPALKLNPAIDTAPSPTLQEDRDKQEKSDE